MYLFIRTWVSVYIFYNQFPSRIYLMLTSKSYILNLNLQNLLTLNTSFFINWTWLVNGPRITRMLWKNGTLEHWEKLASLWSDLFT